MLLFTCKLGRRLGRERDVLTSLVGVDGTLVEA